MTVGPNFQEVTIPKAGCYSLERLAGGSWRMTFAAGVQRTRLGQSFSDETALLPRQFKCVKPLTRRANSFAIHHSLDDLSCTCPSLSMLIEELIGCTAIYPRPLQCEAFVVREVAL